MMITAWLIFVRVDKSLSEGNFLVMIMMKSIPDLLRKLHGARLSSDGKRNVFWCQNHLLHHGIQ